MDNKYHPCGCKEAIKVGGIYICNIGTTPCALYKSEKCYKQRGDEAIQAVKKILEGEDNG